MKSKLFSIISILCLVFSLSLNSLPVFAQENNNETVEFMEKLVIKKANSFAKGVCPEKQLNTIIVIIKL